MPKGSRYNKLFAYSDIQKPCNEVWKRDGGAEY
jgi:hypothetical protein